MRHPLLNVLRLNSLDLWRTRRTQTVTLISLLIGFFALFLSLGLRESQQNLIAAKARELLTGDAQVSATRPATEVELEHFAQTFKPLATSNEVDTQASLRFKESATLVELKAVGEKFPLIGRVQLESEQDGDFADLKPGEVWLAEELKNSLGIQLGDKISIGAAEFTVSHWISADVGFRRGATGFAPRAYISILDLSRTELVQPGSQVQFRQTVLLNAGADITQLKTQLQNWPDELVIRSPDDAINGIKRGIGYVESYLSLITLLLMLLGFISGFYLLQIHLRDRALTLALGLLFGAKPLWLEVGAVLQILVLMLVAWLAAAGLTFGLFESINPSLATILPGGARLILGSKSFLISGAILLLNTVIFTLPFALRFRRMEPESLLNQSSPSLPLTRLRDDIWPYGLALIGYSSVAAWLQQSWIIAVVISAALISFILMAAIGLPRFALRRARQTNSYGLQRLAWLGLARPRLLTTLVWVALGWSAALSAVIPNLLGQAQVELKSPSERDLPQLFAINVRPEDVEAFTKAVADEGAELRHASPLILARLRKINNTAVTEGPVARFPVRLTFRPQLTTAEKIVAGQQLPAVFSGEGLPGISVEVEFAKRNNLNVGDKVEFEVAGLPLNALVQNLREVKWNTFQPNFFMQFAGGVLEEYPKSYLAVIYGLKEKDVFAIQGRLSQKFPSLSLLNLATTIDRLSEIAGKLIWPIATVSIAGLLMTLILVALLSIHLWQERIFERQLFHWLGAGHKQMRQLFLRENFWLAGSALIVGSGLGLIMSVFISHRVFDRWAFPQEVGVVLLLGILSLTLSALPIWFGKRTL